VAVGVFVTVSLMPRCRFVICIDFAARGFHPPFHPCLPFGNRGSYVNLFCLRDCSTCDILLIDKGDVLSVFGYTYVLTELIDDVTVM
jgi:hypothetical protein